MSEAARARWVFVAWTLGGVALALAGLDFFASDLVLSEVVFREQRLHVHFMSCIVVDPWSPSFWSSLLNETAGWGRALIGCFVAGLVATLTLMVWAREQRWIASAIACANAAAMVGIGIAAALVLRHETLPQFLLEIEPGLWIRWYESHQIGGPEGSLWQLMAAEVIAAMLAVLAIPTATVASAIVMARHWSAPRRAWLFAAALGLPLTIVAVTIMFLWLGYEYDPYWRRISQYAEWPEVVLRVRWLLVALAAAIGLLGLHDRPEQGEGTSRTQTAGAGAWMGLGLALLVATTGHRAAIDGLFPRTDLGLGVRRLPEVPKPWTLDVPRVATCLGKGWDGPLAVAQLDEAGEPVFTIGDDRWRLGAAVPAAEMQRAAAEFSDWFHSYRPPQELRLLVDRRIAPTELAPFIAVAQRMGAERAVLQGVAEDRFVVPGGEVVTWNVCSLAELAESEWRRQR